MAIIAALDSTPIVPVGTVFFVLSNSRDSSRSGKQARLSLRGTETPSARLIPHFPAVEGLARPAGRRRSAAGGCLSGRRVINFWILLLSALVTTPARFLSLRVPDRPSKPGIAGAVAATGVPCSDEPLSMPGDVTVPPLEGTLCRDPCRRRVTIHETLRPMIA